jgi:hypothetical protein
MGDVIYVQIKSSLITIKIFPTGRIFKMFLKSQFKISERGRERRSLLTANRQVSNSARRLKQLS